MAGQLDLILNIEDLKLNHGPRLPVRFRTQTGTTDHGHNLFTCQRFRCELMKKRCVERQDKTFKYVFGALPTLETRLSFQECQGCGQGLEIKRELGIKASTERKAVSAERNERKKETRIERKQRRRRFDDYVKELGFPDERSMFEKLLKENRRTDVARFLNCTMTMLWGRINEYGITEIKGRYD